LETPIVKETSTAEGMAATVETSAMQQQNKSFSSQIQVHKMLHGFKCLFRSFIRFT
jgi:hypothetical protein